MQIDKHIIDKINDAHDGVVQSSKDAIQYAIYAGRELNKLKEQAEHGQFLSSIKMTFNFSERTARNYMKVADYSANVQALADLQEAYKLIESEESKKKQLEQASQRERLQYRTEHKEKPDTWQRSDDYAWQKLQQEKKERDERISNYKDKMKEESERRERLKADDEANFEQLSSFFSNEQAKQDNLKNIRISNQNGAILDFLADYLDKLDTDSKRIEECHNIIKFCKDKSRTLQVTKML